MELQYWRRLLRYSCAFTLPVFMLAMVLPMMPGCEALFKAHMLGFPLDELLKWAFATPVQFWIGWRFHAGAWKALKNGRWGRPILPLESSPSCCMCDLLNTCCPAKLFLQLACEFAQITGWVMCIPNLRGCDSKEVPWLQ